MAIDLIARGMANSALENSDTAIERVDQLPNGIHFVGAVDSVSDLPAGANIGDTYIISGVGSQYTWGVKDEEEQWIENGRQLADVAKTGSYNDLLDKPEIPEYLASKEYVDNAVSGKQDTLTAGANIQIRNNIISATGGGGGITEDGKTIIINEAGYAETAVGGYIDEETGNAVPIAPDFIPVDGETIVVNGDGQLEAVSQAPSISADGITIINKDGVLSTAIGGGMDGDTVIPIGSEFIPIDGETITLDDNDKLKAVIPTNISAFNNDVGYQTLSDVQDILTDYQPKLTAGQNINIDANNVISASGGGSVNIDNYTIIEDKDGNIRTSIGGAFINEYEHFTTVDNPLIVDNVITINDEPRDEYPDPISIGVFGPEGEMGGSYRDHHWDEETQCMVYPIFNFYVNVINIIPRENTWDYEIILNNEYTTGDIESVSIGCRHINIEPINPGVIPTGFGLENNGKEITVSRDVLQRGWDVITGVEGEELDFFPEQENVLPDFPVAEFFDRGPEFFNLVFAGQGGGESFGVRKVNTPDGFALVLDGGGPNWFDSITCDDGLIHVNDERHFMEYALRVENIHYDVNKVPVDWNTIRVNENGELFAKVSGGPDEYIKSASVSGTTLTLTDQDDNDTTFTAGGPAKFTSIGDSSLTRYGSSLIAFGEKGTTSIEDYYARNNYLNIFDMGYNNKYHINQSGTLRNMLVLGHDLRIQSPGPNDAEGNILYGQGNIQGRQVILGGGNIVGSRVGTTQQAPISNCIISSTDVSGNYACSNSIFHGEYHTVDTTTYGAGNDSIVVGYSGTLKHGKVAMFGNSLVSTNDNQLVIGKYNYETGNYPFIIGGGTNSTNKANLEATDWDGNKYISGNLYVKCNGWSQTHNHGTPVIAIDPPTTDGNYILECHVNDGIPEYVWATKL